MSARVIGEPERESDSEGERDKGRQTEGARRIWMDRGRQKEGERQRERYRNEEEVKCRQRETDKGTETEED